jgi:hypothetical protein
MQPSPPSLVIAGHSHAVALGVTPTSGAVQPRLRPIAFEGLPILGVEGSWPRDERYWQFFEHFSANQCPVVVWEGNQHEAFFLFEHKPAFDFVLSFAPNWPVLLDVLLIPESQLRAFLAPTIAPLSELLDRLGAQTDHPIFVTGTPPPKGDEAELRARINVDSILLKWAAAAGPDPLTVNLTPRPVMLKLWMLVQDMMAQVARSAGAVFVPVPARAKDGGGYLAREYWAADVTHANGAFGRVMLEEVVAAAGPAGAAPTLATA